MRICLKLFIFVALHSSKNTVNLIWPVGKDTSESNWNFNYILRKSEVSNYWMRLSRIWRILQIKEGVINRGQRPRWITPSEIWEILHILRKPNSTIALLFIQNISSFLKEVSPFRSLFFRSPNITQPCPQVLSVNSSIICKGLHFWRHFVVIGSIFCQQQLVI